AWTVQVEPEEVAALEEALDRFAVEDHLGAASALNDLAGRRLIRIVCRCAGGKRAWDRCDRSPRTLRNLSRPTHAGRSNAERFSVRGDPFSRVICSHARALTHAEGCSTIASSFGFDSGWRFEQAGPMRSGLHLGAAWDPCRRQMRAGARRTRPCRLWGPTICEIGSSLHGPSCHLAPRWVH